MLALSNIEIELNPLFISSDYKEGAGTSESAPAPYFFLFGVKEG